MSGIFVGILMTIIDLLGQWFFLTWEFTFEFSFFFFFPWASSALGCMPCPAFFSGKEASYSISSTASPQHFGRLHQESFKSDELPFVKRGVALREMGSRHKYLGSRGGACQRTVAKMGPPNEYFPSVITEHHMRLTQTEHSPPMVEKHTHFQGWVPWAVSAEKSRNGR